MPTLCAVFGCGHNSIRDKDRFSFYRIPKITTHLGDKTQRLSTERRAKWFFNIGRSKDDLTEKKAETTRVCSAHFVNGKPADLYDQNNVDWAPTVNMGHNFIKNPSAAASRGARADKRAKRPTQTQPKKSKKPKKAQHVELTDSVTTTDEPPSENPLPEPAISTDEDNQKGCQVSVELSEAYVQTTYVQTGSDACVQTSLTARDLENQEQYMQTIQSELSDLKQKLLESQMNIDSFRGNDNKTQFYTGLPNFFLLMQVFTLIAPSVKSTSSNALTQFQEMLLVLMRIKINVPLQDLAYRFSVSVSTASRIFDRWIEVMSDRLEFLIHWPDREELRATMPTVFKQNFGKKVSVIIDCFEVFIEKPSSLIARAMTWSNYKHHNTVKFLIGITPQGSISFISKAWGGRVSDKYLTENCSILRKLLPGDIVLADRGFDIADSVAIQQAKLHIPAFTKGKKQLSALEVEETRKIANVRIHVERVIGLVRRKYTILQSILPIHLVKAKRNGKQVSIDRIAKVSCALTNLSDSIVPFE